MSNLGKNGLRVVVLRSRNKDNQNVEGFKERTWSFVTSSSDDELRDCWQYRDFVEHGVEGEICRLYVSVNKRDNTKVAKAITHLLFDKCLSDIPNMAYLDSYVASVAAKKENRAESRWMFDFDDDVSKIPEFLDDLVLCGKFNKEEIFVHKTPNGACIIVPRGFDARTLLEKWTEVELKRDAMICLHWQVR